MSPYGPSPTPSATLMTLKFGSPTSPPSPTNTCSSVVIDGANPGHESRSNKAAPNLLHRGALYSMTYEDAAVNLHKAQCTAVSVDRRPCVLPGVLDMLAGVPPPQLVAQRISLSPNEQIYYPLPRRRRRQLNSDSRLTTSSNSHTQSPRQRVSVACTFCRARKLRCTPGPPPCEHCKRRSHPCTFEYQNQQPRDQQQQNVSSSSTPRDWTSLQ